MRHITPLGHRMPVALTTLSPLHIGGAETLSPLADYWLDAEKNIRLVDAGLLAEAIYSNGQTDNYIKAVKQVADENKGRLLPNFTRGSLNSQVEDLLSTRSIKSHGIHNPVDIESCIKTDGLPYLPGSTLKGALRNALLQHWLHSNDDKAKQALKSFVNALGSFARRSDLTKKKRMSEIDKVFMEKAEEELFGKLKQEGRLAASCLRVQDTAPAAFENLAVYQLDRRNLLTDETAIPVLKECLERNTRLHTVISIDYYNYRQKSLHPVFKDVETIPQLFTVLNDCSRQVLEYEHSLLQNPEVQGSRLREYETFLQAMLKKIKNAGTARAYLRLGFGKMQFYQTIALPLFNLLGRDEENEDWVQYLCYCNALSEDISAIYPATRVLTTSGQLPLGWLEIAAVG